MHMHNFTTCRRLRDVALSVGEEHGRLWTDLDAFRLVSPVDDSVMSELLRFYGKTRSNEKATFHRKVKSL